MITQYGKENKNQGIGLHECPEAGEMSSSTMGQVLFELRLEKLAWIQV